MTPEQKAVIDAKLDELQKLLAEVSKQDGEKYWIMPDLGTGRWEIGRQTGYTMFDT